VKAAAAAAAAFGDRITSAGLASFTPGIQRKPFVGVPLPRYVSFVRFWAEVVWTSVMEVTM